MALQNKMLHWETERLYSAHFWVGCWPAKWPSIIHFFLFVPQMCDEEVAVLDALTEELPSVTARGFIFESNTNHGRF